MVVTKKQLLAKRANYIKGIESINAQISAHAQQIQKLEADRLATVGAVQAIDGLLKEITPAAIVEASK